MTVARSMTTVLAEVARATYTDEIPDDQRARLLDLVREAVALDRQRRGAVEALRDIAKVDPVDAALDPQRPVRIAKAWLREHETGGQ